MCQPFGLGIFFISFTQVHRGLNDFETTMIHYNRTLPDGYGCQPVNWVQTTCHRFYLYCKSISCCQWHATRELVDKVNTVMRMVETARSTDSNCSSSILVDSIRFWSFLEESKGHQEVLSINNH